MIEAGSRLKLAHHAYGLRKGGLGEQEGVTKVRCSEAEVELEGVEAWNVDGELIESGTSAFRIDPTRSRSWWDEASWREQERSVARWAWPAALGAAGLGWYVSDSLRHRREGAFGYDLGTSLEVDSPDFLRAAEALCGAPISEGSEVELFVNGDAIFPAILETIKSAQKTLTFETYVYWRGDITEELSEASASAPAQESK